MNTVQANKLREAATEAVADPSTLSRLAGVLKELETGETEYVVFRVGSNSANQSMCNRAPVWQGYADSEAAACRAAKISGGALCYNNQHLDAREYSELSDDDLALIS